MAIKRLNYFNGQFLREQDFNDEQGYHLSMRRSHNNRTHSAGIVDGLQVTAGTSQVTVSAGMAIDNLGREIILDVATPVLVNSTHVNAFVVIALNEAKTDVKADTGISGPTRWTEGPVFDVVATVPAGAVGLAQIQAVAGNGAVTLNANYSRTYSAPVVGGDLSVGRNLTVFGNLEVKGQTTLIQADQMRGSVLLGDDDTDVITVEGTLTTGHSSGKLQVTAPVNMAGSLDIAGAATLASNLSVKGNAVLGDADTDIVTIEGAMGSGHSSGRLKITSPLDVTGDIVVTGNVDGRDVSADGTKLDTHAANTSNPHATTAAQVDTQGGTARIVAQINASAGVITEPHIDPLIARETRFNTTTGHDHDGTDSKKISPTSLQGVNASVTAAALNALTGGPTSNAAAFHTHPFVPEDNAVTLNKLDLVARSRLLRVPLLLQTLNTSTNTTIGNINGIAFDGTFVWTSGSLNTVIKIDTTINAAVATVTVGFSPFAMVFSGGFLWVANWGSSTVSKIDVATNAVVATINVGSQPNALAVSPGFLWVANYFGNSVSRIDMATNTVVATVPVGTNPDGLAVVGSFVWVANNGSNTVSKIDMATNTVVATVSVGSQPRGLAAATATFLYVANSGANTVSKVDVGANTVVATIPVGSNPNAVAVVGSFLWVGGGSGNVQKIDTATNTIVASVPAQAGPWGNPMVSVTGFLWVSSGSVQLTKIDTTANVVAATVLPVESRGMAFDGLNLWVAVACGQVLKVDINTLQILQTVTVGIRPNSVVYNGSHIFVTNSGSNSVSKIDPLTGTVVATIPVGLNPTGIAYNRNYRTLWVANSGDGTASVFQDTATSVGGTITVGTNPQGVACESFYVWITNTGSNTVAKAGAWVGGTVQFTATVGASPLAIVFDNCNMWVANTGTNTVSKLPSDANSATVPTTITLPAGAVPAKMCFNGTHVVVVCTNGQAYRIDIFTNVVLPIPSPFLLTGGSSTNGTLAFDGVSTWAVNNSNLFKALI